jgi:hypothetical protein
VAIYVRELLKTHSDYRPDLIAFHSTLYEGGQRFRDALKADREGRYLSPRMADADTVGKKTYRDLRIAKAQYSSEISRIVGNIISTAFKSPPEITATGSDEAYYVAMNDDCDGAGTDFSAFMWKALECGLLHRRSYLAPTFPEMYASDAGQQAQAGGLDGKLAFYSAADVNLWLDDVRGVPVFRRVYTYEDVRQDGWRDAEYRLHTWSFVGRSDITTYTYRQPFKNGQLEPIPEQAIAEGGESRQHGYSRCPVSSLTFSEHFWVADKLSDGQIALFNSEADERFIRSQAAHPIPIITGQIPQGFRFFNDSVRANVLPPGCTFQYVGADASQATWHETAITRERANMYAALDAMKLYLSTQPQNARQSGDAKKQDSESSVSLIRMFAAALKDCAMQPLRMIAEKRGKQVEIDIKGLEVSDEDSAWLDDEIARAKEFLSMNPPAPASKHVMRSLSLTMCDDAPQDVVKDINETLDKPSQQVREVEVNGAVAQGLLALVGRLMTAEEARQKIGLDPKLPDGLDPTDPITQTATGNKEVPVMVKREASDTATMTGM